MADKRKKKGFFDGSFDDEMFDGIEDIIDHLLEQFGQNLDDDSKGPFIYGFSVSRRAGEDPEIRKFGSILQEDDEDEFESHEIRVNDPGPLIDVFEIDGRVHVMAELPGAEKDDIDIYVTESSLEIKVSNAAKHYSEFIDLPSTVNPDSSRATYVNGVLEAVMDKMEFGKARLVSIE